MRRALSYVFIILAAMLVISGCKREGRIIPERKLVRIYEDMFMADQWLQSKEDLKDAADTTWFYERIFRKYGYTFKDYNASINYYIDKPDKFAKVFTKVQTELNELAEYYSKLDAQPEPMKTKKSPSGYVYKDFSIDSLRWASADTVIMWPETVRPKIDTVVAEAPQDTSQQGILPRDTLKIKKLNAPGRNSIRTNKKQTPRTVSGDQFITFEGEVL